jgi:hypothetical protein
MLDGLTEDAPSNIEGFEGMRALHHQRYRHQDIFAAKQRQRELPEVETARERQQSTGDRFHSFNKVKLKGSSKRGCARALGGGQQLLSVGTTAIAGRHIMSDHSQVLEKRE